MKHVEMKKAKIFTLAAETEFRSVFVSQVYWLIFLAHFEAWHDAHEIRLNFLYNTEAEVHWARVQTRKAITCDWLSIKIIVKRTWQRYKQYTDVFFVLFYFISRVSFLLTNGKRRLDCSLSSIFP